MMKKIITRKMANSSGFNRVLQVYLITIMIVLIGAQGRLTATERRVLEGFTNIQDGQVHLLDTSNVLTPTSHIDLPGEHGNQSPHPIIHRKSGSVLQGSGAHVVFSGGHGNNVPVPVVRRPGTNAHVDLPGQHGNQAPVPVVHRETDFFGQTGNNSPNSVAQTKGAAHVDLPGQHGNESPHPVVHRQTGFHVDLPGQHGNESPHPVVHRQTGFHVDLPGQHGNESPHPVVHRQTGFHVDLPGQHGNESPHPVVHRQTGSHGNESPVPVVHRDGVHVHRQDGNIMHNSGFPRFIDPVSGTPVEIQGQNNDIRHGHSESGHGVNRLSFDSVIGERPTFISREGHQSRFRSPIGLGLREVFPEFSGRTFRGPFESGRFGPLPLLLPPEGRIRQIRGPMRRRIMMSGLPPPPFPPLSPPPLPPPPRPPRIGLGGILAGIIGNLFGNLFRQ